MAFFCFHCWCYKLRGDQALIIRAIRVCCACCLHSLVSIARPPTGCAFSLIRIRPCILVPFAGLVHICRYAMYTGSREREVMVLEWSVTVRRPVMISWLAFPQPGGVRIRSLVKKQKKVQREHPTGQLSDEDQTSANRNRNVDLYLFVWWFSFWPLKSGGKSSHI